MRQLGQRLWDVLILTALLWTVYEEQRHLGSYLAGEAHEAAGIAPGIDVVATLVLLGFAVYELFHLAGATRRFDRFIAAHPASELFVILLLGALGWGIFRDALHFRDVMPEMIETPREAFDALAAIVLALGLLKLTHHGLAATKAFFGFVMRRTG